jgi:hypothetical protein
MPGGRSALIIIAFLAATTSNAWAEACENGICANSVTNGRFVSVTYHVQHGPVTHVNIRSSEFPVANCEGICPDPFQREGGASGAFDLLRSNNGPTHYAIQICVRGGLLAHSTCGPWANFNHGH